MEIKRFNLLYLSLILVAVYLFFLTIFLISDPNLKYEQCLQKKNSSVFCGEESSECEDISDCKAIWITELRKYNKIENIAAFPMELEISKIRASTDWKSFNKNAFINVLFYFLLGLIISSLYKNIKASKRNRKEFVLNFISGGLLFLISYILVLTVPLSIFPPPLSYDSAEILKLILSFPGGYLVQPQPVPWILDVGSAFLIMGINFLFYFIVGAMVYPWAIKKFSNKIKTPSFINITIIGAVLGVLFALSLRPFKFDLLFKFTVNFTIAFFVFGFVVYIIRGFILQRIIGTKKRNISKKIKNAKK